MEMVTDLVTLSMALVDFDRLNPPGRFRKALIDWAQFKTQFTVSNSVKMRQGTEEWTFPDFEDEKTAAGWDKARIRAMRQKHLDSD